MRPSNFEITWHNDTTWPWEQALTAFISNWQISPRMERSKFKIWPNFAPKSRFGLLFGSGWSDVQGGQVSGKCQVNGFCLQMSGKCRVEKICMSGKCQLNDLEWTRTLKKNKKFPYFIIIWICIVWSHYTIPHGFTTVSLGIWLQQNKC